jgi:DNA-binding MarR family transcriptional regulator
MDNEEKARSAVRRRRRLTSAVRASLRELGTQLSVLNHRVGGHVKLRTIDVLCLDVIDQEGPLSPSALARKAGLHPATMTGVLDRLERGGWITRDRDHADRRGVSIRVLRDRGGELIRLYSGMNTALTRICSDYSDDELATIADFLDRTAQAGREATDHLSAERST